MAEFKRPRDRDSKNRPKFIVANDSIFIESKGFESGNERVSKPKNSNSTSMCSNCKHPIVKLNKAWFHFRNSALQNSEGFIKNRNGEISLECTVPNCNCKDPIGAPIS